MKVKPNLPLPCWDARSAGMVICKCRCVQKWNSKAKTWATFFFRLEIIPGLSPDEGLGHWLQFCVCVWVCLCRNTCDCSQMYKTWVDPPAVCSSQRDSKMTDEMTPLSPYSCLPLPVYLSWLFKCCNCVRFISCQIFGAFCADSLPPLVRGGYCLRYIVCGSLTAITHKS